MAEARSGGLSAGAVTMLAALVGALAGFGGSVANGWFSFASKDEAVRVHLVEIAIGILRADPKEDVAPARAWAIEVIEKNSGVPFNPEDRAALLQKRIAWDPAAITAIFPDLMQYKSVPLAAPPKEH